MIIQPNRKQKRQADTIGKYLYYLYNSNIIDNQTYLHLFDNAIYYTLVINDKQPKKAKKDRI